MLNLPQKDSNNFDSTQSSKLIRIRNIKINKNKKYKNSVIGGFFLKILN